MAKLKAYINRDSSGNFIPGSVVYSATKPTNGNYALIVAGVEQNNSVISNPQGSVSSAYTEVIRKTYPRAAVGSKFANTLVKFIKSEGYFPENVLLMETECADDINAPIFSNLRNIGQTPEQIQEFAGSFKGGGLGGFSHTGVLGFQAFISHQFSTLKKHALLIIQTPHIGISKRGEVGRIIRKGKVNEKQDNTCGAIAASIDYVINNDVPEPGTIPGPDFDNNDQYYKLVTILFNIKDNLTKIKPVVKGGSVYGERMKMATDYLVAYQNFLNFGEEGRGKGGILNGPALEKLYADDLDIYVMTGTFINTDYQTPAHYDVNSFKKMTNSVKYNTLKNKERQDLIDKGESLVKAGEKEGDPDMVAEGKRLIALGEAMPRTIRVKVGNRLIIEDITKKFIKSL
jgi:hypothetical protein